MFWIDDAVSDSVVDMVLVLLPRSSGFVSSLILFDGRASVVVIPVTLVLL